MTSGMREDRVHELSDSSYITLRDSYRLVQEMKGMVDRLHVSCVQGKPVDFDNIAALKLVMDRLYDDMERYMRPECDPDSAHPDAMTEVPGR